MLWYVLQTKTKQERIAIFNLEDQGFETYLPLYKRRRRGEWLISPLFPGYLFIKLDLSDMNWKSVNGTRGVKRLMCMDPETPSPVPLLIMDTLMQKEFVEDLEKVFLPGDRLKISEGIFKDHTGVCEISSHKRVTLLLKVLGGERRVQIDATKVIMVPA